MRDETLGEDRCQIHQAHAPRALSILKNAIMALLRHQGWSNIAAALRHYGASVQNAIAFLALNAL